jgi:hypothetical protein
VIGEAEFPGGLAIATAAHLRHVLAGDEDVVDAVAVAAAAEPAVLPGVRVPGPVGVDHPGIPKGLVEGVFPGPEDRQMRPVARLDDIQVPGDDDRAAEPGQEAGQRRSHGVLEGALVLVAPLLRATGGHIQPEQSDGMAAHGHRCGRAAVSELTDSARDGGESRAA